MCFLVECLHLIICTTCKLQINHHKVEVVFQYKVKNDKITQKCGILHNKVFFAKTA